MSDNEMLWTNEAETRVSSVPEGFMRNMTKKRIEEHAIKNNISEITLKIVENVIENSRAGMGSMMGGDMDGMPDNIKQMLKNQSEAEENKEKDKKYYFCFVCNYAIPDEMPTKCPNCDSETVKFSILESQYRTEAHTIFLKWSESAIKYLESTPDDYRRTMTKFEIEAFARRKGYKVVTRDVVSERMEVWANISKKVTSNMEWENEAKKRTDKVPAHIRGMIIKETELFARDNGDTIVTSKTLDAVRKKWGQTREFHVKWQ